ncbi:hypothetical protein, partial [Sandarakinorhabdus sp.]|uniref:hypothetical protein n=1 Tax=Sandarakinorhabdus sp. TaxID=1916663 RepID=UPI00286DEFD1
MTDKQKIQWISACEAVGLLAPVVGGDAAAKAMMADRLRDGVLKASAGYFAEGFDFGSVEPVITDRARAFLEQCQQTDTADGVEIKPIDQNFPKISQSKMGSGYATSVFNPKLSRMILGNGIWRASADWEKDLKRWDWGSGTFICSSPAVLTATRLRSHSPGALLYPRRTVVYAVEFDRSEIVSIVTSFTPNKSAAPSNDSLKLKKRRRRSARKHDWEAVLLDLLALAYVGRLDT